MDFTASNRGTGSCSTSSISPSTTQPTAGIGLIALNALPRQKTSTSRKTPYQEDYADGIEEIRSPWITRRKFELDMRVLAATLCNNRA